MNQIFEALQLNQSFFYQFAVALVFFIVAPLTFFNKLKFILERREESTTKLEGRADGDFQKAQQLADDYKKSIDDTYAQMQKEMNEERAQVQKTNNQKISDAESKADEFIQTKIKEYKGQLDNKKKEILAEAQGLTEQLVSKVTR